MTASGGGSARQEKSGNTGGGSPQKTKPVSGSAGANRWRGGIAKNTRNVRGGSGAAARPQKSGNTG